MTQAVSCHFPAPQGKNNNSFTLPPLDGSLTFSEYFQHHAVHSSSHPLFLYPDGDTTKSITYAAIYCAQIKVAHAVKEIIRDSLHLYPTNNIERRPVIGILATADTISFVTTMLGIMQTGCTPFPISTRNSSTAVANLCRMVDVHHVFVSEDPAMQTLSQQAIEALMQEEYSLQTIDFPRSNDLYDDTSTVSFEAVRIFPPSSDSVAVIFHSSGTSSFPKLIEVLDRNLRSWGVAMCYGEIDMCDIRFGIHSTPMFHAMAHIALSWAVSSGIKFCIFKPSYPPIVPTPEAVLEGIVATKCDYFLSVPSFIEEWSRDNGAIETLRRQIGRLIYAGTPLNKQAGDTITAHGIFIESFYGMTETGALAHLFQHPDSRVREDWEYFRFPDKEHLVVELIPQEDSRLFEVVIMPTMHYSPNVINTTVQGKHGFATGDLVMAHPTTQGWFKIYGWVDEQIMLSTGEKTNPVPLERILLQDPHIASVIFFGRGRFNSGALIQPTEPFDPKDRAKLTNFRNDIWPTVRKMNSFAPAHSRLLREMILVTDTSKPIELTGKNTPRRNATLAVYEDIELLYKAAEAPSEIGLNAPSEWKHDSTHTFVQMVVHKVLERATRDDEDFFQSGCDSLQATSIRNGILHAIRLTTRVSTGSIPQSFIYKHPSINALSGYIFDIIHRRDKADKTDDTADRIQAMLAMVEKHSTDFPLPREPSHHALDDSESECVLVTGTTGRLGCHILVRLVQDPNVHRIFALNRDSASASRPWSALHKRQIRAFENWGLDTTLLSCEKLTLIPCSYSQKKLGISNEQYEIMPKCTTKIIHTAWRIDFNVGLSALEPLIVGVRRLIDVASRSRRKGGASFTFISSISFLFRHPKNEPALEKPVGPYNAAGFGYAESKWVAESLLLRAREAIGLNITVVRIGQLAGDTVTGAWNEKEWVPAMLQASLIAQALPERDETITWLPVDVAAAALMDVSHAYGVPVLHLVAPKPAPWTLIIGSFAKRLEIPMIPYSQWVDIVAAAAEKRLAAGATTSALMLVDFFREGNFGDGIELSTAHAVEVSPTLANAKSLDDLDAVRYLEYWRKIGFV